MVLKNVIGAVILVFVGLLLFNPIISFVANAQANPNVTADDSTLLGFFGTIYLIGLFVGVVALMLAPFLGGRGLGGGRGVF